MRRKTFTVFALMPMFSAISLLLRPWPRTSPNLNTSPAPDKTSYVPDRGQRVGSGVTLTNMFGRRLKVSTVIFEIKPLTLSGSS